MADWWERPPEHQESSTGAHLFVCQHGLWGSPEDVAFLEQYLQHNGWLTLNARSNSARCTFDGADVCGDRLADEVVSHVQRLAAGGVAVTHISFAAYSFGGLIARYAVGKLLASGFFSLVAPVNFLTIASPHLGCWEHPSSMSHLAYNSILPWTLSRTGRQLLLADRWLEPEGLPLLAAMARPDCAFHAALAAFRKRVLLADIRSDRTVPYTTAAITAVNPYLPGGAAAAAPYALPAGGGSGAAGNTSGAGRLAGGCCGGGGGCTGCVCGARRGFAPLTECDEGEEEEEEDEVGGPSGAFCDRLGLGDGDGDGGGVGAGAGGLLGASWGGNLLGLGSVLNFGMGVVSLLFGGGGGGGRRNRGGRGGDAAAAGRARCSCCGGVVDCAAAGAAMIPLPISSSYPCIVTPHPAPPAAALTAAACPAASKAAAAACALHRSASSPSPLPKLRHAAARGAGDSSDGGGGGRSSDGGGSGKSSSGSGGARGGGRRAAATVAAQLGVAAPAPAAHGRLPRHGSDATLSFAPGGCAASGSCSASAAGHRSLPPRPKPYGGLESSSYGSALYRLHQVRHGRWYDQAGVPGAAALTHASAGAGAGAAARAGRVGDGGGGSGWLGGGGGSGGEEDALASRVRLGLFVALLPVLLSLWLCMVAWLAAIWIHHYAVLLTVRPDRSWNVRLREPAAAATNDGGGGSAGGDAEASEALAATDGWRDGGDGDGGGTYGRGEVELCMSLTEAPPPSPSSSLLLQRRRTARQPELEAAAAAAAAIRGGPSCRADDAQDGSGGGSGLSWAPSSSCAAARGAERSVSDAGVMLGPSTGKSLAPQETTAVLPAPVEADAAESQESHEAVAATVMEVRNGGAGAAVAEEPGNGAGPEAIAPSGPGVERADDAETAAVAATEAVSADANDLIHVTDAGAEVSALVRSIFSSVAQKHDGGRRAPAPGLSAAASGAAVNSGAELEQPHVQAPQAEAAAQAEAEAEAERQFVCALTRSIFQSLATRHSARLGGDSDVADPRVAGVGSGGGAAAAARCVAVPSDLPDGGGGAAAAAEAAALPAGLPAEAAALQQPLPSGQRQMQHQHQQHQQRSAGPGPAAARPHDPAALLCEMIANLNLLEWQKVDVDTRHYHAHAAIVVRSSRRFRSHIHIIDYAVRQLRMQ